MTFLDNWQIQSMQDTQEMAFPDVCTVRRIVNTSDGFGGVTTGQASVVQDDVPFRATPAQSQMMGGQGDRMLEIEKWTLRFPVGSDIRDRDIIDWNAKSLQLQVEDAKTPKSYETAFTVKAEVVRNMSWEQD